MLSVHEKTTSVVFFGGEPVGEFQPCVILFHFLTQERSKGKHYYKFIKTIDLVTVFDDILTSRQTGEKLQCLYENLMSNNFRRTAVLKKKSIVN